MSDPQSTSPARVGDDRAGLVPMPEDQAAWVREAVWPRWMKRMDDEYRARKFAPGLGCFLFRMSPCELDVCPPCTGKGGGGHDMCRTRRRITDPAPWWKTIEENWTLAVHGSRGAYHRPAEFLPSCRGWLCPCGCWRTAITPAGQLVLDVAA